MAPFFAHAQDTKEVAPWLSGKWYSRLAVSYQHADGYHSGYNSDASSIFDDGNGEYTFVNYSLDTVYILPNGFYVGSGLYASRAKVGTDLNIPDTDSNIEIREIPLALGYDHQVNDVKLRFEGRFLFNVDDDFDDASAGSETLLPVTDGSDSFTFSVKAKKSFWGFDNSLLLGYQIYENDVSHPLYPSFSLGDRFIVDYEISKSFNHFKIALGHLYSQSEQTGGTEVNGGGAYLVEKPRYSEMRASVVYRFNSSLLLDCGLRYIYDGKDAPKQKTAQLGIAYLF